MATSPQSQGQNREQIELEFQNNALRLELDEARREQGEIQERLLNSESTAFRAQQESIGLHEAGRSPETMEASATAPVERSPGRKLLDSGKRMLNWTGGFLRRNWKPLGAMAAYTVVGITFAVFTPFPGGAFIAGGAMLLLIQSFTQLQWKEPIPREHS